MSTLLPLKFLQLFAIAYEVLYLVLWLSYLYFEYVHSEYLVDVSDSEAMRVVQHCKE